MSIPLQKCTLVDLDRPRKQVEAYFNPSKIKISKKATWNRHKSANSDVSMLEFTSADNQTLSVELFFDGYEQRANVYEKHVKKLLAFMFMSVKVKPKQGSGGGGGGDGGGEGGKENKDKYRPPFVMLVWGEHPPFKGVIESLDVEYTMFLPNGRPVRATCSLQITEVHPVQIGQYQNRISGILSRHDGDLTWEDYVKKYAPPL